MCPPIFFKEKENCKEDNNLLNITESPALKSSDLHGKEVQVHAWWHGVKSCWRCVELLSFLDCAKLVIPIQFSWIEFPLSYSRFKCGCCLVLPACVFWAGQCQPLLAVRSLHLFHSWLYWVVTSVVAASVVTAFVTFVVTTPLVVYSVVAPDKISWYFVLL